MQDRVGNSLAVGDQVAIAILAYKSVRLEVGEVTAVNEEQGTLRVTYKLTSRWAARSSQTVTRHPCDVAKLIKENV